MGEVLLPDVHDVLHCYFDSLTNPATSKKPSDGLRRSAGVDPTYHEPISPPPTIRVYSVWPIDNIKLRITIHFAGVSTSQVLTPTHNTCIYE